MKSEEGQEDPQISQKDTDLEKDRRARTTEDTERDQNL